MSFFDPLKKYAQLRHHTLKAASQLIFKTWFPEKDPPQTSNNKASDNLSAELHGPGRTPQNLHPQPAVVEDSQELLQTDTTEDIETPSKEAGASPEKPAVPSPADLKNLKRPPLTYTKPKYLQETAEDQLSWYSLTFTGQAINNLDHLGLAKDYILEALSTHKFKEDMVLGRITRFYSADDQLFCRIDFNNNQIMDIFTKAEQLDTLQEAPVPPEPATPKIKVSGQKAKKPISLPKDKKSMEKRLNSLGFHIHAGKTHDYITHPDYPGIKCTMANTPSDTRRVWHNIRTEIKHTFGIDICDQ